MADKTLTIAMRLDGNKDVVAGVQKAAAELTKLNEQVQATGAASEKAGKQKIDWKAMAAGSTKAKMSMQNLQYTLRDAPYLFQNLQMGITAVGENAMLMVTSFVDMKREAGGAKNFMGLLAGSLMGPAGIAVALSAVLFLVQSFSMIMGKAKKKAQEAAGGVEIAAWSFDVLKNNVKETQQVLDQLSFKQVTDGIRILNDEYAKLQKTQDELVKKSEEFFDPTGAGFVDEANLAALRKSAKTEKEILEKQAAFRSKILQAAGEGKISGAKIDELMPVFEQELARRNAELAALSERAPKKLQKERQDAVKAIQDQIDKLKELKTNVGDLENVELQLAEKNLQLKQAKGDAARKAILDEIKALEELQKKLKFQEDEEKKGAGKSRTGKSDAELEAEYEAKRAALEAQLAILRGERTELEVLAAREQALNEEKVTANKERQQEIELELLNIAIDREKIAQRTADEREKEAKAHEDALLKIAEQQRKNELARNENALIEDGTPEQNSIQARLNMQLAAFNARKKSLNDELNALEEQLQNGTFAVASEYDQRVLLAEQMKGQIIGIEGQILQAKLQAADQITAAEARAVETRRQAAMSLGNQFIDSSMQLYSQMSQSRNEQEQQRADAHRSQLEQDRDAALSKAKTEQQRAAIQKKYDDEIAQSDAALKAKQAKEQTRMFQFQQGVTFVNAQMNAIATYPEVMKQMGVLGPFVAPALVLIALAQAARILTYKAPGYAQGGLIKVSNGESYLDEETFQKLLPQVMMLNKSQQIRGAGTGTSDSIFAMADGGFVLNADTTRRLRGFADGGDVLNRDLVIPESPRPGADNAMVEAINNLSSRIDRNSSMILWYMKNPPPAKAFLDKKQSAAVINVAEYDINRGRLQ